MCNGKGFKILTLDRSWYVRIGLGFLTSCDRVYVLRVLSLGV